MSKTPEILIPALRQYQHNRPDGEFVTGFDYDDTVEIVTTLGASHNELVRLISDVHWHPYCYTTSSSPVMYNATMNPSRYEEWQAFIDQYKEGEL